MEPQDEDNAETQSGETPQQLGWAWGNQPGVNVLYQWSSTVSGSYADADTTHKLKHLG